MRYFVSLTEQEMQEMPDGESSSRSARRASSGFAILTAVFMAIGCSSQTGPAAPASQPAEAPAAALAASPASAAATVAGTVPTAADATTVVTLLPQDPSIVPSPAETPLMDQIEMTFVPGVLIARTGQPVRFTSSDEELHNINVRHAETRDQEFNVAIPTDGTFDHTFNREGLFDVNCDIHPTMTAQIVVASTPYVMRASADGRFEFQNVVPGAYTLRAQVGTRTVEQPIQVGAGPNQVAVGSD